MREPARISFIDSFFKVARVARCSKYKARRTWDLFCQKSMSVQIVHSESGITAHGRSRDLALSANTIPKS